MASPEAFGVLCVLCVAACAEEPRAPAGVGSSDATAPDSSQGWDAQGSPDGDAADAAAAADASPASPFVYFDINHVLSTGQSLSVGATGTPALSITQPFANQMFAAGVIPGASNLTQLVPLVEAKVETMSAGLANLATELAQTEAFKGLPAPRSTHRLLVSVHGVSGIAYVGLKKGTAAYAAGLAQVTAASQISKLASLSYVVRAVTNVHGESDHIAQNAAYEQNLVDWQRDYDTDIKGITGQSLAVPMLQTQISSWTKYGQATSPIVSAQLAAHVNNPGKIVLVGAKYFLPYSADGVHLTNAGYRQMGEYYAKVYRRVVLEGQPWEPVRPKSAKLAGAEVRVVFHVTAPPLVFDTTLVKAALNQGFEFADDSGAPPTITGVVMDGPDAVKVTLAAPPTGKNPRIRYAFTGLVGASAGPQTGPRGNLRDSDATASRSGSKLYNWAVHFEQLL